MQKRIAAGRGRRRTSRDDPKKLSERLEKLLTGFGQSGGKNSAWLAKKLGVTPGTICRYLSGERIPSLETIAQMERILGGKLL